MISLRGTGILGEELMRTLLIHRGELLRSTLQASGRRQGFEGSQAHVRKKTKRTLKSNCAVSQLPSCSCWNF